MTEKEEQTYADYLMNPKLAVEYVRSESQHQVHTPMPLTFNDEEKNKTKSKATKKQDKPREVKLKDFDKQLFNKDELTEALPKGNKDLRRSRRPIGAKTMLRENQKLRSENEKLHAMCLELTSMIKQLNKPSNLQPATKSSTTKTNLSSPDKHKKRPSKPADNNRGDHYKQEKTYESASEVKLKTKQEDKSMDIRHFQVKCLVNEDLEQYERENRHRYVPKDLSKKNLTLGAKIDKDIR